MKQTTPGQRLRNARKKRGYKTATDAARAIGRNPVTYTAHENGGRDFDVDAAREYAEHFGVQPEFLLFGDGYSDDGEVDGACATGTTPELNPLVAINDLPNAEGMAPPAASIAQWHLPEEFLTGLLRVKPAVAWIFTYQGDSQVDPSQPGLAGTVHPGDRVIIDTSDRRPSPPGIFLIHDGTGLLISNLEVARSASDRKGETMIRVSARNPQYATYEIAMDDLVIVGRVKGKIGRV